VSTSPREPVTGPADPELDPSGSYALDPRLVSALVAQLPATSGESVSTSAPFTGQRLAEIPTSTPRDVAAAVRAARTAQREWAARPLAERARVLLDFHDLVLDRRSEAMDLIQWENGKARKHAFEEVAHVAMTARYYGLSAQRHLGSDRRSGLFPLLTQVRVNQVPKGVVGIISPWNYPFTMGISDGLPALLAGNGVVHKPDSQTVLTALFGVQLLREAGLPEALWQPVAGDGPVVGGALIDNVDYVCFTGSTRTGRLVAEQAGRRLIGASLELGGKNPMLVLRDADVERAAEAAVRACFSSSGQLCVSIERMYVADEVHDRFLDRFLERVEDMRMAADFSFETDMGSLISPAQLDTVTRHVVDALDGGAVVLTGGKARPDVGPLFHEPTVLADVMPGMACFGEETFGPVVSVYRFGDEADAIARANEGSYGLNASIFSRDVRRARRIAALLRCGTVNINEGYAASFGSIDTPMGGMRDSGTGRRQGVEGVRRYTEAQTVAVQRGLPVAASLGMSEQGYQRVMVAAMRAMKRLGRP